MASDPAAGWFVDPLGRHPMRYWDGTRWTEHVSAGGDVTSDPLPPDAPVPPPTLPAVLTEALLVYEYAGPAAKGGWPVSDREQRQIARVTVAGFGSSRREHRMLDAGGAPVLTVFYDSSGMLARTDQPLPVLGPSGTELGRFRGRLVGRSGFEYEVTAAGAPTGRMRVSVTDDAVTDAVIEGAAGHRVATITQARERLSLFKVRASFTLDRGADLADPLRVLAVAAPLALHCDLDVREDMQPGRRTWTPLGF